MTAAAALLAAVIVSTLWLAALLALRAHRHPPQVALVAALALFSTAHVAAVGSLVAPSAGPWDALWLGPFLFAHAGVCAYAMTHFPTGRSRLRGFAILGIIALGGVPRTGGRNSRGRSWALPSLSWADRSTGSSSRSSALRNSWGRISACPSRRSSSPWGSGAPTPSRSGVTPCPPSRSRGRCPQASTSSTNGGLRTRKRPSLRSPKGSLRWRS